jgi:hypothetical protein
VNIGEVVSDLEKQAGEEGQDIEQGVEREL